MSARLAGKVAEGSCLKPLLRKGCWRFAPPLSIWFVCALLVLATPLNFEARRATGHGASASAVSTLPLVSAPEVPSHQLEPRWCGRRSIVAVGASFFLITSILHPFMPLLQLSCGCRIACDYLQFCGFGCCWNCWSGWLQRPCHAHWPTAASGWTVPETSPGKPMPMSLVVLNVNHLETKCSTTVRS